jgi:outer membrane receptor for Fe3+-dicitrate
MSQKFVELNGLVYSNSQKFYNGFYSSGISNKGLALQLGGSWIQSDGFKEHSGDKGGSGFYSFGLFKEHNVVKIYGFTGLAHNQLAYLGVPMDTLKNNYKKNLNSLSDKDTFNQNLICLNWVNDKVTNTTFNTSGYFSNVNGDYSSFGTLYGVKSYQGGIMTNIVYKKSSYILNFGVNGNIYSRTHFGSDFKGFFVPNGNDTIISQYENTGHKKDVIGYIKIVDVVDNFNLFIDVQARYVNFDITNSPTYKWLFFNPKIGFKYINGENTAYLVLAITDREPTRTDMTQNAVQNSTLPANTDNAPQFLGKVTNILPERVFDVEIGYGYHTNSFNFSINAYSISIQDEYAANGFIDPISGFMVKKVLKSTLRTGVESEVKYKIKGFSLFGNFQYQYSRYCSDVDCGKIPFSPDFITSGGVSYSRFGVTIGLVGQLVGPMVMNLSQSGSQIYNSNIYGNLNGYVGYTHKNWTISLKLNNIMNQKYYIPAGIGYYDFNSFHKDPTFYVGQTFTPSLSVKFRL